MMSNIMVRMANQLHKKQIWESVTFVQALILSPKPRNREIWAYLLQAENYA